MGRCRRRSPVLEIRGAGQVRSILRPPPPTPNPPTPSLSLSPAPRLRTPVAACADHVAAPDAMHSGMPVGRRDRRAVAEASESPGPSESQACSGRLLPPSSPPPHPFQPGHGPSARSTPCAARPLSKIRMATYTYSLNAQWRQVFWKWRHPECRMAIHSEM